MTICEILTLRTDFEDIIKDFNMGCQVMQGHARSDINTIEWFIEHGHRSNSLRNGFNEALTIAKTIKEYSDGCTEEIRSRESV